MVKNLKKHSTKNPSFIIRLFQAIFLRKYFCDKCQTFQECFYFKLSFYVKKVAWKCDHCKNEDYLAECDEEDLMLYELEIQLRKEKGLPEIVVSLDRSFDSIIQKDPFTVPNDIPF
jgi:hypothetical protein